MKEETMRPIHSEMQVVSLIFCQRQKPLLML